MLRDPKLQKKAIDYALDKLNPAIQNVGSQALNQLSTKIRPNKKYTTNRKDLDGGALDIHKAIVKLPRPKSGPGHKYTGPYNDLENQLNKYGWIIPLKDKKGESVTEAFETIFKEGRKPQYLWVDKGKEFYNEHLKDLLEKNRIHKYSTENEEKSSVVERWNRTIKSKMWKQFTVQGNTQYLDMLPKLVKQYNNTKHSSIKMTPVEASDKRNEGTVYFNLYGDIEPLSAKAKFKVGDKVRISKYKRNVFDKGYTPNWTEEVFIVDKMQYTNPITYKLKDLRGEDVQGSFYEPELLKAKQDVFRIDKVIRRNYKKKQALVKWKGYSDEFNCWIPLKDIENI
ncbi:uncharacterized protein [Montipora capricornis]|uniref:uncharacterized protein n=1 Tax=Montipora capricornis TaxID=246305 RepID=UPI0035F13B2D